MCKVLLYSTTWKHICAGDYSKFKIDLQKVMETVKDLAQQELLLIFANLHSMEDSKGGNKNSIDREGQRIFQCEMMLKFTFTRSQNIYISTVCAYILLPSVAVQRFT